MKPCFTWLQIFWLLRIQNQSSMAAHSYNPSYLGCRDWQDHSLRLAWTKSMRPCLKNKSSKKGWGCNTCLANARPWVQSPHNTPSKKIQNKHIESIPSLNEQLLCILCMYIIPCVRHGYEDGTWEVPALRYHLVCSVVLQTIGQLAPPLGGREIIPRRKSNWRGPYRMSRSLSGREGGNEEWRHIVTAKVRGINSTQASSTT
jgi:hypothetical protein